MLRSRNLGLAGLTAAVLSASPVLAQTAATWASAATGTWTDATMWSTSPNYPNNGTPAGTTYTATIAAAGPAYTVGLGSNVTVQSFTLNSPDAALSQTGGTFNAGTASLLAGSYVGSGGATLAATSITGTAGITAAGAFTLNVGTFGPAVTGAPGSALTLAGNWSNAGSVAVTGGSLTLAGTPGTIGTIALDNSTLNVATSVTAPQVNSIALTNSGVVVASGGSVNNQGNTIALGSGNPTWTLAGGLLQFGAVTSAGGAKLLLAPGTTSSLSGVSFDGGIDVPAATTLRLGSAIANTGTIAVASGGTLEIYGSNLPTASLGSITKATGGRVNITGSLGNSGSTLAFNSSTGSWEMSSGLLTGIFNGTITGTAQDHLIALGGILNGTTVAGTVTVGNGVATTAAMHTSAITFSSGGQLLVQSPTGATGVGVLVEGTAATAVLDGAGEVAFAGPGSGGFLQPLSASTLTLGAPFTVRTAGAGGVLGKSGTTLLNKGLVSAQTAGQTLSVVGTFNNQGTAEARNGGTLLVNGNVTNSGTVTASSASAVKVVGTLTNAGKVDLAGGSLVLDYTGASPADSLRQQLRTGRAGGNWNATSGVVSSTAAADAQKRIAVGYAEASTLGVSSWAGLSVDSTAVVTKVTYYGDANLDGKIDANDLSLADRGLAMGRTGWVNGDFNYDGVVNSADFALMDRAYAQQGGVLSADLLAQRESQFGDAYVAALVASVPEPGTCTVLVACGSLLVARRRR